MSQNTDVVIGKKNVKKNESGLKLNYFLRSSLGQGMTEYILIVVLIAVAALVTIKAFGGKIKGLFSKSASSIESQTQDSFGK